MSVETFHGCPSAWIAAKPTSSTRFAMAPGDKFPSLSLTKFKKKKKIIKKKRVKFIYKSSSFRCLILELLTVRRGGTLKVQEREPGTMWSTLIPRRKNPS